MSCLRSRGAARVLPPLALTTVVALALTTVPAPAEAAPQGPTRPALPVLELAADDDRKTDAQLLTNELRRVVIEAPEYAGASSNPDFVTVAVRAHCSTRALERRLAPDSDRELDAGCLKRVGAQLDVKRLLWGYVYEQGGARFAKVHFYREGEPDRVASVLYDPSAWALAARRLYAKLITPERVGDVRVGGDASLAGAELVAGGTVHGPFKPGLELTVPAGEFALKARRDGKVVAEGKAQIAPGGAAELRLRPVFEPRTNIDPTSGLDDPPPPTWKRPAGFVGLGVGALLIGAGVVSSLRVKGIKDDFSSDGALVAYRSGIPGDACDSAASGVASTQPGAATVSRVDRLCSALSTFEATQFVLYGVGALAAGAGAYFLASAPRAGAPAAPPAVPDRAAWSLRPWGGPRSGGLGLNVSF